MAKLYLMADCSDESAPGLARQDCRATLVKNEIELMRFWRGINGVVSRLSLAEQGRCRKLELHVDVNGKPHSRLPVPWLSKLSGGSQQSVAAETFHEIVRAFQTLENAPAGHTALSDAWQKVTGMPVT